jgi:lantibiotic biosynthesis protein
VRSLGTAPEHYRALARDIERLPVPVELPRLFQVDLVKPAPKATLGPAVVEALSQAAQLLYRLQSRAQEDALSRFRTRFTERYEEREVPLVEALDEESGIGFDPSTAPSAEASPLLAGLAFPPSGAEQPAQGDERVTHLASLVYRALQQGSLEVELQEEDLRRLEARSPRPPPDAFCVMATLAAPSDEALAHGDFQLVVTGVDGPSGARMLGRFCHGNPELQGHVEAHLRAEEALRPEAVFAELVHLPAGRIGNVLCRPVLRAHEIPYLGRSGAAPSQQLPVTDLHLSVQGGRILLRSASLDREVVPRLTNAHNHGGANLGLYRFLAALRVQDGAGAAFSWGALSNAEFLPRLRVGRTVLTRAHWRVDAARLKRWAEARGSELFRELQAFRAEARLPRFVAVEDADNVLPVDLDNVLSIESFAQLVRKRSSVTLTELYPTPGLLCAKGPEGRYTHELVVPFVRAAAPPVAAARPRRLPERMQPLHAPGSGWLYAKLYGGTATVDQLLRSLVPELLRPALERGAARRWFFLRYGDPQWHLRLRVGGDSARLHAEVLPRLHALTAPLLADGSLWKVQLDTYVPEVARYGGPEGLALSERLFEADSEAALHILQALPGEEAADGRWRLALRGMDALLDDLGLTLEQKAQVLRSARKAFGDEFRVDGGFERQLGDRFRKERRSLETLLDPASDGTSPLAEALAGLHRRSERLRPVGAALAEAQTAGRLELPIVALAGTYLHMHANRLLRSAARAQELVLYDFLLRLYESRLARIRKGQ